MPYENHILSFQELHEVVIDGCYITRYGPPFRIGHHEMAPAEWGDCLIAMGDSPDPFVLSWGGNFVQNFGCAGSTYILGRPRARAWYDGQADPVYSDTAALPLIAPACHVKQLSSFWPPPVFWSGPARIVRVELDVVDPAYARQINTGLFGHICWSVPV